MCIRDSFLARDLIRDPAPPEDVESIEVVRMPLEDMLDCLLYTSRCV